MDSEFLTYLPKVDELEEINSRCDAYEKQQRNAIEIRKKKHFEESGVGEKFLEFDYVSMMNDENQIVKEVNKFIQDVQNGSCRTLWMCGNNGTGKTTLASYIVKECWGTFRNIYTIEDEIKVSESFKAVKNRQQVFSGYKNIKLLVIDEVGRFPSDNEKKILFHILNDRYENDKSTVLVTNLSVEELKKYLGKALTDRAIENCKSITFGGESYRVKKRKENENNLP